MPTIAQLLGGAGTGKTTRLLDLMAKVIARGLDPTDLGFVSFTRAARSEAAGRAADQFGVDRRTLEQAGWFRTLHSVCYRCLRTERGELVTDTRADREWLQEALQEAVAGPGDSEGGFAETPFAAATAADGALALWHAARNRLEPLLPTWERAAECDDRTPDYETCRQMIERYESAKHVHGRCDFTDLLGQFAGWRFHPDGATRCEPRGNVPGLPVWFFDEQQDTSAILDSVCRRLIEHSQWVYLVGDPFQCQPAGTPVLTTRGYTPIEELNEDADYLIAFNCKDSNLYGMQKRIPFRRATRLIDSGAMYEITLEDGTSHYATENHKWLVRIKRGNFWEKGVHRKNSSRVSRITQTCNLLPGVMTLPKLNREAMEDGRKDKRRGIHRTEEMRKRKTLGVLLQWLKITSVKRLDPGRPIRVYSLDVEKHHTYITQEYITCNSIYGWAGADPKHFLSWPVAEGKREVMPVSYRCPAEILSLGEDILRECSDYWDREIRPAGGDGEISREWLDRSLIGEVDPRESWLLLARTNREASRLVAMLNEQGIPWQPTRGNGGWAAPVRNAALRALWNLEHGAPVNGEEWRQVLKILPAKSDAGRLLVQGTKARFDDHAYRAADLHPWVLPADLAELGATEILQSALASGRWREQVEGAAAYCEAAERWGTEVLDDLKVRVGTIHSVKGSEADNVLLLTATTKQVAKSQESQAGFDEERRVEYVAVTRARQRLILAADRRAKHRMRIPA
jgi:superfamily I DNA/RNA helicase